MAKPQTYRVKKGDTLSGIAKNFGVKTSDIGGFRSGNADLIFPDEELSIGKVPSTNTGITQDQASKMSTKDLSIAMAGGDYNSTLRDELGEETPSNIDRFRTDSDSQKTSRDAAFTKLQGISTDTFNSEYDNRKLSERKERISSLDSDIAAARQLRDDAISKVRANPGLSAAQMTGDIAKLSDAQNAVINNLIGERNSTATEYNAELGEIDSIVERAAKDAQLEFGYWDGLFNETTKNISDYESVLRQELKSSQDQNNFETQLAQQLQIAQMKGSGGGAGGGSNAANWKLVYDDSGFPLYWFNSRTKEIDYNVGNSDESGNNNSSFADLEASLDKPAPEEKNNNGARWFNPFSWANYF